MTVQAGNAAVYVGVLSGEHVANNNGNITVNVPANSGDIWISEEEYNRIYDGSDTVTKTASTDVEVKEENKNITAVDTAPDDNTSIVDDSACESTSEEKVNTDNSTPAESSSDNDVQTDNTSADDSAYKAAYEDGVIAGLHEAIIARMEKNGFVTDQMRRDVYNNTHHDSLINWIKSF